MSQSHAQGKNSNLNNLRPIPSPRGTHFLKTKTKCQQNRTKRKLSTAGTPGPSAGDWHLPKGLLPMAFTRSSFHSCSVLGVVQGKAGTRSSDGKLATWPGHRRILKEALLPAKSSGCPLHSNSPQATMGKGPTVTFPV